MQRVVGYVGSLKIAVPLLIAIAAVLGWGTLYEARFGTAAVQQVVYRSWWFQGLLAFLGVNLAVAALSRYPWQRRHIPFVLAHIGIILILIGGIVGGRFGIEGQLIIPEGQAERILRLPHHVVVARELNPGIDHIFPVNFEATAWVHEPQVTFHLPLVHRQVRLTIDRYYPDAAAEEQITGDGDVDNPALRLLMSQGEHEDAVWLFAREPSRSSARWANAHVVFVEAATDTQWQQLLGKTKARASDRGALFFEFPALHLTRELAIPKSLGRPVEIPGTPYRVTFKDYFADFALSAQGPVSRSDEPNNPAISFILSGPEGTDAHLLFALHPEFPTVHGLTQTIPVHLRYAHPASLALPPQAIALIRSPSGLPAAPAGQAGALAGMLTGDAGQRRRIEPLEIGKRYTHPWLRYDFVVSAYHPRASVVRQFTNRSNEVRAEVLHVIAQDGPHTAEAWLAPEQPMTLPLGPHPLRVEYRQAQRELPFTITLLDFRKIDYPGTTMAAGFESDVELTDPQRGLVLLRKISMNNPLRYRGFSFYQASYISGPTETTVLAARSDPGTPLVYAGFLIVMAGVTSMFILRSRLTPA